jgi:O-Antigen ligase
LGKNVSREEPRASSNARVFAASLKSRMVQTVAPRRPSTALLAAGTIALGAIAAIAAFYIARGSPMRDALVAILLLAPLIVYLSLVRPLLFPYGLYILLMPFDMFLGTGHAGTLTKFLGVATGLLLFFFCLRTRRIAAPTLSLRILVLLLVWMAITLLWSLDPSSAQEPLQTFFGLALLYAALALAPASRLDFDVILAAIVVSYLVAACYAIATMHGAFPARPSADDRLLMTLGTHSIDPNEYADSLIFPVAIALMLAFRSRFLSLKLIYYGIVGAMVTAIAVSASREAAIALLVLIAYFLWRSRHRVQLLAVTLGMAFAVAPFFQSLLDRFQTALSTGGAGRTSIWSVGLVAGKHYGLIGAGIGNFSIAYDRFYIMVPQTYLYGWSAPPHNVPLRYFVELGVVGFALIVSFVAAHFIMLRSIPRDHPLHDYRIVMEGGLIGICTAALFIDSFHSKWTWLVFATTAQLVYLASSYKKRSCSKIASPELQTTA